MLKQMTISEVITLWKTDKKQYVKKSSFSAYVLLIENHILPEFGNECQLSESRVQDFIFRKLDQGLSQKTVKDMLIVLKMILKFGVKNQWLRDSPLDIRFPTEREKQHIEVLSKSQQKKIMQHIQQHFTFRNLGIYICLSTGLRIGEVCALSWEDVDTDMGIIRVSKSIQRIYTIENEIRKTELILDTPKTKNSIREILFNEK